MLKLKKAKSINGTCLQGYVQTTYAKLVEVFGEPHYTQGDKTTAEWAFDLHGVVFTIYDYKNDVTPTDVYRWHIGGYEKAVLAAVKVLLPNTFVTDY